MYKKNVISTRELLSDSFNDRNENRNQWSEHSQNSQFEFSQINTQDMFTQHSGGSQPESNGMIPNKRPSFYDKWKAKMPVMQTISAKQKSLKSTSGPLALSNVTQLETPMNELPFQQQIQMNKAKAKERDERDLLQQVIKTVQECTKEMKFTLHSLKERIESQHDSSSEKIEQTISTFLEDLCKFQDKMFDSIMEKDVNSSKVHSLEVDIAKKDAKIVTLEKVIEGLERDCSENVIKTIQEGIRESQQQTEKHIQQILEWTKENKDLQKSQFIEHKKLTEQQIKHCDKLYHSQEEILQQIEKRILDELATFQREIKRKDTSYKRECSDQIRTFQEQQINEIERLMQKMFEKTSHISFEDQNDLKLILKGEMQEISKKQLNNFEKLFKEKLNNHFYNQENYLSQMFSKLLSILKTKENAKQENEYGSFLSLPQFEERMGQWNEDFKKQLETLHKEHMAEIKRLKGNMIKQPSSCYTSTHQNTPTCCSEFQSYSTGGMNGKGFKSLTDQRTYLTGIKNSDSDNGFQDSCQINKTRSMFVRPVFSPVAAILPQRKETEIASVDENKGKNVQATKVTLDQTNQNKKKRRRKKAHVFSVRRKSKPKPVLLKTPKAHDKMKKDLNAKELSPDNVFTARITRSKSAVFNNTKSEDAGILVKTIPEKKRNKTSVYDFNDEEENICNPPNMVTQNNNSQNKLENRCLKTFNTLFSSPKIPCEECSSRNSSPSLSITEMVIRRKIRCKKDSPTINLQIEANEAVGDILSTPNMVFCERRQWNFQENFIQPHQESKVFRRSGEKRKLCDVNFGLDSLALTSLFRKKPNYTINIS